MEDKMHLKSETAYFMMLQEGEEARVYLKDDVDAAIAAKDAEIARLKAHKSPDIADALALSPVGKRLVDPAFAKKEPVVDTREAVAELKDEYCTHCVICDKPWGAGAFAAYMKGHEGDWLRSESFQKMFIECNPMFLAHLSKFFYGDGAVVEDGVNLSERVIECLKGTEKFYGQEQATFARATFATVLIKAFERKKEQDKRRRCYEF